MVWLPYRKRLALKSLFVCMTCAQETLKRLQCPSDAVSCRGHLPSPRKDSALRHCPGPIVAALSSMLPATEACPLPMRERCRLSMRVAATACVHTTAPAHAMLRLDYTASS